MGGRGRKSACLFEMRSMRLSPMDGVICLGGYRQMDDRSATMIARICHPSHRRCLLDGKKRDPSDTGVRKWADGPARREKPGRG